MSTDDRRKPNESMIKENLQRAFQDKATEDLPAELLALLAQLRDQDEQNND